jgi:hypothetical protein
MKKVNLMDIMESLDSGDQDTASAALHEWFVGQAAQVHQGISGGPVEEQTIVENTEDDVFDALEEICDIVASTGEESGEVELDYDGDLGKVTWQAVPYGFDDQAQKLAILDQLEDRAGDVAIVDSGYYADDERQIGVLYVAGVLGDDMDQAMIGEAGAKDSILAAKARQQAPATPMAPEPTEADFDAEEYVDSATVEELHSEVEQHAAQSGGTGRFEFELHPGNVAVVAYGPLVPGADEDAMEDQLRPIAQIPPYSDSVYSGKCMDAQDNELFFIVFEPDEDNIGGGGVEESSEPTFESLMAELQESFKGLETVSDKLQNQEGAQVGEQGKVPVNKKSTLPNRKGAARLAGEPVEIKGKGHTGHTRETAPKVADVKLKGNVQNSKDNPTAVKKPTGALLNKMDGSVNTQSPISGKGAKGLKK